jgi:hypothetical protein
MTDRPMHGLEGASMSPANRYGLKRVGIKLAILTLCALALWPLGIMRGALFLAIFSALLDVFAAVWRRERLLSPSMTYWDEAAIFLVIFLGLLICDQ